MDNDDDPVGRILTRREAIAAGGLSALAWLAGCSSGNDSGENATSGSSTAASGSAGTSSTNASVSSTSSETTTATAMSTSNSSYPATGTMTNTSVTTSEGTTACVAQTELTEGPYYVDENLRRSDIRTDTDTGNQQEGTKLDLSFNVFNLANDSCSPLDDALVDVWHANADGVYSDVESQGTSGKDFLRGIQETDDSGEASFTTIYPGWYTGRAVHIHFKIRSPNSASDAYEFTSQLFFDEDLTDQVFSTEPYSDRDERDTRNSGDNIFSQGNANQLLLDLTETDDGYAGTLNVAFNIDGEDADEDSAQGAGGMGGGMNGSAPNGSAPNGSPPNGSFPGNGSVPNGSAPSGNESGNETSGTNSSE